MLLRCGATGDLGGRISRKLAERGESLRLLVRSDPGAALAQELGAEAARGDLRDPASLAAATDGADTVITSASALGRALGGEKVDLRAVDRDGTLALIDAAERAGARRFVLMSSIGVGEETAGWIPVLAAKLAAERRLAGSNMQAVIVRPAQLQEVWFSNETQFDWRRGRVTVFGHGDAKAAWVGSDDVAEAAVRLALAGDPPRAIEFGGPEALTRNETVAIFERATGRGFKVRHVPRAAMKMGNRVLRGRKPELASVMGLSLYTDSADTTATDAPLRELGIEPRSVAEYARELVATG